MSDERLKPCPFCESRLEMLINKPRLVYWHPENECLLSGRVVTETEIEKWNTRKPMERIVERLEERASAHERIMLGCANVEERHLHCRISNEYKQAIEIVKGGGADE